MSIIDIVLLAVGFILGGGAGGVIAYLWKSLSVKAQISELEKNLLESKNTIADLTKKNAELEQKCIDTQSALANTLSALELLKAYQVIDQDTKSKVKNLQDTLVDGKASQATMESYKDLLKKMNDSFSNYNNGNKKEIK